MSDFTNEDWVRHLRSERLVRRTLVRALVPLLKAYQEADGAGGIPEAFEAFAMTTGPMGGNYSHGGELTIRFTHDGCGMNFIRDASSKGVTLVAQGDWEQAGLICALMQILEIVLPIHHPTEDE